VRISLEEPPPAPRPILKPVSGGVLNGTAISLPQPVYPEAAKRTRTAGLVSIEVILDESGKVISATAMSGPTLLREAAVQAALRAKFSPTKLSGQPVKVSGTINYKFALVP
jgi:protein TonB